MSRGRESFLTEIETDTRNDIIIDILSWLKWKLSRLRILYLKQRRSPIIRIKKSEISQEQRWRKSLLTAKWFLFASVVIESEGIFLLGCLKDRWLTMFRFLQWLKGIHVKSRDGYLPFSSSQRSYDPSNGIDSWRVCHYCWRLYWSRGWRACLESVRGTVWVVVEIGSESHFSTKVAVVIAVPTDSTDKVIVVFALVC